MKNKYIFNSKITEKKLREILWFFCIDIEATKISEMTLISRPTINKIIDKIRLRIYEDCENQSPLGKGSIELDESYFGARRVRGIIVLFILKMSLLVDIIISME